MPKWTHHRARVAALSRDRAPNDPELLAARRDLAEARRVEQLEDHVKRVADHAPLLTSEQRDRLALLLRGPSNTAGASDPARRHRGARATEAAAARGGSGGSQRHDPGCTRAGTCQDRPR